MDAGPANRSLNEEAKVKSKVRQEAAKQLENVQEKQNPWNSLPAWSCQDARASFELTKRATRQYSATPQTTKEANISRQPSHGSAARKTLRCSP